MASSWSLTAPGLRWLVLIDSSSVLCAIPMPYACSYPELLSIWKYFHMTLPTALREMWISSSIGAAYRLPRRIGEIFGSPRIAVMGYRHNGAREDPWEIIAAQVDGGSHDGHHHSGALGLA
jgi:hypothetical protein